MQHCRHSPLSIERPVGPSAWDSHRHRRTQAAHRLRRSGQRQANGNLRSRRRRFFEGLDRCAEPLESTRQKLRIRSRRAGLERAGPRTADDESGSIRAARAPRCRKNLGAGHTRRPVDGSPQRASLDRAVWERRGRDCSGRSGGRKQHVIQPGGKPVDETSGSGYRAGGPGAANQRTAGHGIQAGRRLPGRRSSVALPSPPEKPRTVRRPAAIRAGCRQTASATRHDGGGL